MNTKDVNEDKELTIKVKQATRVSSVNMQFCVIVIIREKVLFNFLIMLCDILTRMVVIRKKIP